MVREVTEAIDEKTGAEEQAYKVSKDFFEKHMPGADDEVLVVLKGHLLLEQAMEKIISKMVCNPKELYGFSFSQKIQILKAIIPPDKVDFIRHEALLIVNQIRNQLAHRLEPKNIENLTRDLAKAAGSRECPPDSSLAFQLHRSISYLCGFLNGIEHSLPQAARK